MREDWWLSQDKWANLTPEQKFRHRVNVRAYFLSKEEGKAGSLEANFLEAENEERRADECTELYDQMCRVVSDKKEVIRLAILRQVSIYNHLRVKDINDNTLLPTDPRARQSFGRDVGYEAMKGALSLPSDIKTVADLRELLEAVVLNSGR